MTIPLAGLSPSPSSCQPEPAGADGTPPKRSQARGSYLALLLVGLAMPSLLPATRWSLKPPFHPYLACKAVCFLWRYPSDCSAQALPGTIPSRSPDFPRCTPRKDATARSSNPPHILSRLPPRLPQVNDKLRALNRVARSSIIARSVASNGPTCLGRNLWRNASKTASTPTSLTG